MQPSPAIIPNNTGCHQRDPELNKPKILTTPIPDIEKSELSGCGRKDPELKPVTVLPGGNINDLPKARTDTAHGPISQPKAEDFILQAKAYDGIRNTWIDSNGAIRTEGDYRDVDVKYPPIINHLFDNRDGHLINTEANKQIIMNLIKNPENFIIRDDFKKYWFAKTLDDGTQIWAHIINDVITNCGINETPREGNSGTGLSRLDKPKQK